MVRYGGDLLDDERGGADVRVPRLELMVEDDDEKRYVPLWLFGTAITVLAMALAFVAAGLLTVLARP